MLLFYKELKSGLKKDEALRQAKIKYLNTANRTKLHPYYWAAFVPFGDSEGNGPSLSLVFKLYNGFSFRINPSSIGISLF
jgi:hypothetical protein